MKAAVLSLALLSGAAHADTVWYTIVTGNGTPIGHASEEVLGNETIQTQDLDVGETVGPSTQLIARSDGPTHMSSRSVTTRDASGRVTSMESWSKAGRGWSRITAAIGDGKAEILRESEAGTHKETVALTPDTRFDDGDTLIERWDGAPKLEFENFNLDAMAVDRVTIEATSPPDGQGRIAALRKRYEGRTLLAVAKLVIDHGGIVEATQPLFGASITARRTDRETALKPHPIYRVLPNVMTKSPFLISHDAMTGHIRYRFAFRDGIRFEIPETGEQRVRLENGEAVVDICADCGPGLAADRETLADALKPTAYLQSDAPALHAIADPIARLKVSDAEKMEMLRLKAKPYLGTIDFTGHYSALETLSRKRGDCTESSVLLAALGRAAGIPTRVVNGLVYSRESYHGVGNVFMPHSWTLAFADGKWKSFDLALDRFDATHIALTIGDGDERTLAAAGQLGGLLQWQTMAEVRTAP